MVIDIALPTREVLCEANTMLVIAWLRVSSRPGQRVLTQAPPPGRCQKGDRTPGGGRKELPLLTVPTRPAVDVMVPRGILRRLESKISRSEFLGCALGTGEWDERLHDRFE
jgi:hypothetical protein